MSKTQIYKAQQLTSDTQVPNLRLNATEPFPSADHTKTLAQMQVISEEQAAMIADKLHASLPQTTLHSLLVEFLKRKTDLYVGAQDHWKRKLDPQTGVQLECTNPDALDEPELGVLHDALCAVLCFVTTRRAILQARRDEEEGKTTNLAELEETLKADYCAIPEWAQW